MKKAAERPFDGKKQARGQALACVKAFNEQKCTTAVHLM